MTFLSEVGGWLFWFHVFKQNICNEFIVGCVFGRDVDKSNIQTTPLDSNSIIDGQRWFRDENQIDCLMYIGAGSL